MTSQPERTRSGSGERVREGKRIERIGFRLAGIGGEFTSHVVAGLLLGWGADWYFEVQPWGIVGGLGAGLAVGTLQFIRHASALNREMGPVKAPPGGFQPVEPDDESDELDAPEKEEKWGSERKDAGGGR